MKYGERGGFCGGRTHHHPREKEPFIGGGSGGGRVESMRRLVRIRKVEVGEAHSV